MIAKTFRLSAALRVLALVGVAGLVSACSTDATLDEPMVDLGDFDLGHNIVVTTDVQQGPFSRNATEEELQTAIQGAMEERFGRYEGEGLYHLGLKLDAYALAAPGIPIVFKPRSVLVISANIWDDSTQSKLNDEPKLITAFEGFSGETFIGSGLTQGKEKQLQKLSRNAAYKIEQWLLENGQWFGVEPIESTIDEAAEAQLAIEALTGGQELPEVPEQ